MGGYAERELYELNGSPQSPRLSHHPEAEEFTCCGQRRDIHGKESHTKPGVPGTCARECSPLNKWSFKALTAARGWWDARSGCATAPCQAAGRTWGAEPVVLLGRRAHLNRILQHQRSWELRTERGARLHGIEATHCHCGTCQDSEEGPAAPSPTHRLSWRTLVYRDSSTVQRLIYLMWDTDFSPHL